LLIDSASRAVPRFCCVASLVSVEPAAPYLFRNYTHTRAIEPEPAGVLGASPAPAPERSAFASALPADPLRTKHGSCKSRVWQAIRCTSAAPYYFDDVLIGDARFQDGGLVANNPGVLGFREAQRLWPGRRIGCVVSVGTGQVPDRPRGEMWRTLRDKVLTGTVLLEQATSTQLVADALEALCPLMEGLVYERLQPTDSRCHYSCSCSYSYSCS